MTDKKYKVIVSDRAKRMLGAHIRFIAQVNKDGNNSSNPFLESYAAAFSIL